MSRGVGKPHRRQRGSDGGALAPWLAVLVVGVVVAAVFTTFLVLKAHDKSHYSSLNHERSQLEAVAGQYAIDFTSVDYRHMQTDFDDAAKNATSDFAKKYLATVKVFKPLYVKGKVVQTTTVRSAAVQSMSPNDAVVLVALAGTATNVKTQAATQQLFRMQVSLTRVDGKWLTSNVVPL
ncbi:MAG TPA: hypothetical protein VHA79_07620 [Mycobacteriales bacterium]|nr:hypothetical protein [Mycobacteriales bacterium]HVX69543.1 hypothetical protein [Mycobacteriales bacterium]